MIHDELTELLEYDPISGEEAVEARMAAELKHGFDENHGKG